VSEVDTSGKKHDPFAVWKIKDFRNLQLSRFTLTFAIQLAETILGWKVYQITKNPLALGLIGLSEALPFICATLIGGYTADTFNRFTIVRYSVFALACCFGAITYLMVDDAAIIRNYGVWSVYIVIGLSGIARGFLAPSIQSIFPMIVPRNLYANGATWGSNTWQTAAVMGPAVGGLLYGYLEHTLGGDYGELISFSFACCIILLSLILFTRVKRQPTPPKEQSESFSIAFKQGMKFVFSNQFLLGAITLDLFAVLFGGAVALLPVFASDILLVGPQGLGWLRAAPFFGSVMMGIFLAFNPPMNRAGTNLLLAVAGFGIATIGFALSTSFGLSIVMLFLIGAFDNISVVIRGTILQTFTPDNMRGRVSAVNQVFISSSNEIGAFESGMAARLMGTVTSVIFGGSMTLVVVLVAWLKAPKLKGLKL